MSVLLLPVLPGGMIRPAFRPRRGIDPPLQGRLEMIWFWCGKDSMGE
jgi:hypothetical protein